MMAALIIAWALAFLLAAGLTLGALIALALGRLLREAWLDTLLPILHVMARGAPVLLPLALPLLLAGAPPQAAAPDGWFDPGLARLRALLTLMLWIALGWLLTRGQVSRRAGGGALVLLVLTGAILMQDWALAGDVAGAGSLQALALTVEFTGAAMALATLLAIRGGSMPAEEARTGLERALLSLAMATLWLRFIQFVVVYAADLPVEAAWYLRRSEGIWGWLEGAVALPMLLAAIALGLVPQWQRWRLATVGLLMLGQCLVHVAWVVGPPVAAEAAASQRSTPG